MRIQYVSSGEDWAEMELEEVLSNFTASHAMNHADRESARVALSRDGTGFYTGGHDDGEFSILDLRRHLTPWEFVQTRLGPVDCTEHLRTSDDDSFVGYVYNGTAAIAEVEPGRFWTIVGQEEVEGTLAEVERALYLMLALYAPELLERNRPRPGRWEVTLTVEVEASSDTMALDEARHAVSAAERSGQFITAPSGAVVTHKTERIN